MYIYIIYNYIHTSRTKSLLPRVNEISGSFENSHRSHSLCFSLPLKELSGADVATIAFSYQRAGGDRGARTGSMAENPICL